MKQFGNALKASDNQIITACLIKAYWYKMTTNQKNSYHWPKSNLRNFAYIISRKSSKSYQKILFISSKKLFSPWDIGIFIFFYSLYSFLAPHCSSRLWKRNFKVHDVIMYLSRKFRTNIVGYRRKKLRSKLETTIIFIMFFDALPNFFSPQVKRSAIISNKYGI